MHKRIHVGLLLASCCGFFLQVGCGKRQQAAAPVLAAPVAQAQPEAPISADGTPSWVYKGSGAREQDGEKVFFGVGAASGIRNLALARATADNRARAEIAKIFETYSSTLMRDYAASTTSGSSASGEEQSVEQVVKTFSAQTLVGVSIVDHWFHPSDGTVYALAKLDLAAVTSAVDGMRELGEKAKSLVRRNAASAFEALAHEERTRLEGSSLAH